MLSNIKLLFVSIRFREVNTADIGMEANLHSNDLLTGCSFIVYKSGVIVSYVHYDNENN